MNLFTTGHNTLTTVWRELRARTRLVAAAFARTLPPDNRLQASNALEQTDLLSGLNRAGQTAGLHVWDWDLVTNTLKFDRNLMDNYGGSAVEAEANPGDFISRAVHPEDIARYRREFVRALKGETPLCIDYRVLHKDGSCYPVQLRGQVFRGPSINGQPSRATRVVGFTIDMRSQLESAKRIEKQHDHQQQLIERLALAAEAAGIGVWDWDLRTDRLRSDANMARIFDQADADSFPSAREFTAKIVHPEDFRAFYQAIEKAVLHGDRVSHRYRHQHADGSLHHVQLHGRVIRDTDKKPLRLLVITRDITKEVEAQSKIEHQAKQLQQWVDRISLANETAGIGMWDWDLATGKLSSDTNMAGIFRDANLSGVVNAKDFVASILHPEDRIPFSATMLAATKPNGDNRVSTAFRYLRTDGGVHHVELHGRIVRNAEGLAERFLGISWNVTAKVEAQAEIERQSGMQRALLERLNLATEVAGIDVWDWDVQSDRFTADAHMTKSYGTTHINADSGRELIKRIVHPDDIDKYLLGIDAALASGQSLSHRYRMVLGDGTQRHVQAHGRVFRDSAGKAVRMLGISLDITDEVEHLNELHRQADEERALRDRLNLATETAGIAIWDQDMISGRFHGDARFWELFGRDEPVAKFRVQDGIHPDVRQAALAPVYAVFADPSQNEVLSIRHRTSNPKRDLQYVQSHMRLFRSADGKPVRLLGVTWDVTDEMQANAALKQKADKERALVERLNITTQAAGISPWEFDIKKGEFSWHGQRLACFGMDDVPLNEYYKMLATIVVPEDRHLLAESGKQAIEADQDSYEYRFRVNGVDGRIHYIQNYARVLRGERGKIRYCVGVTWDVTKEVEAAEQLRSQAELERALVGRLNVATQAAGISPWEFDLKTDQFIWFGIRLSVLGLDDEPLDTYFAGLRRVVLEEDRHILVDAPLEALKTGVDVYSYRYRVNGIDGQLHHLKNFVRVLRSPRGTPYRLVGVTWDISEEVAANELLQRQAEHERTLVARLNVATQAAGISPWEFDLKTNKYNWFGARMKVLGLDDEPLDTYYEAIKEILLPEDRNVLHDAALEAITNGIDMYSALYRANGIDGKIHYLKNFVRVLRSPRGTPYRLVGVTWDISEEVSASERLEEQAQHAHALKERLGIATLAAGISPFEIDLATGKFLWVENPIKALTGIRGGDGKLTTFSQRIHPDDVNNFRDAIVHASKGGYDVINYRYRGFAGDGSIVHVRTHAKLYFSEKRRAIRALGVSWDITNEVAAAEQLRHQTERLREVERRLERASLSSSEGHWEAELATGHLWCSSSFHALLGYLEGELEARVSAFDVLVHADDHSKYHEALRKHLVNGAPYNVETRLRMASGEYRWFRMRGTAERNAEGQPTVMAGSIHDVHQQKLAEDALAMAQRRFERAINGTQDGLWELDVNNQTAWCSPRLALLLGYPIAELESRNFLRALIHPDDAAKVSKVTESHYRHNTPFDLELRLQTRGGDHRWYRARASAERDTNGRAVRLSGSLQDVTEARAAREELVRATEAAEAASRAKSAFLANVSHEIRTPMNGIIGMTGLLIDTQLDRTQRDYANTIRGSADSLLTVINDILDFSKIEAGKLDLESIEMDLRANVEDVGAMMAFQAANKGLELIINVHPEVPERVLGDPQRVRQCLINLLGNAIKFTKQGEIVIDVCVVGRHEGKVLTHFEVRDTGMGIPDATLKTLFQPFVQADSSTTRHFGGTGLGLSIVRRLVEMMGGQVGVVSKVGEGSNFFFTLSLEPKEESSIASATRHSSRSGHILIVDDNATNRRVLDGLLTHQGHRVTCADGGAAALESLRAVSAQRGNHGFDMVITDFQMPDMDGVTLGEKITKDPLLTHLRLVMLTSLDRQGDSKHLAALGFAAYLTKPVRTRELLDCVTHVLSGEARQWQTEMRPMLTRNSLTQTQLQPHFAGHVLVVEDNLVNQKVAARFLERMGCTVHIAGNGAVGVAMFKERAFDAVLMDLQMPVMDGLTATRTIRELESGMPGRVPIIALTANAMRGDRERCEAAGMDGFLTKPIEIERLRDTLTRFGLSADSQAVHSEATAVSELLEGGANATPPSVDLARLNEITGGDPEFAKELIETFIASCQAQLVEIDDAINAADYQSLARSAHKLKGACANIHAEEMRLLVARLESEALNANVTDLPACNTQLQQAFARAKGFLSDPSVAPASVKAAS